MAVSTITHPFFKLQNPQPNLHYNHSSNKTLINSHFPPPKPLLIASHNGSHRFRAIPVKFEEEEEERSVADINTKLYFGNLPYNVDSASLAQIIQDFANPELVEVLYNRDTRQSRGFAFVTMSNIEDCNTVTENLDGTVSMGG